MLKRKPWEVIVFNFFFLFIFNWINFIERRKWPVVVNTLKKQVFCRKGKIDFLLIFYRSQIYFQLYIIVLYDLSIYLSVCVCVFSNVYEVHTISFQTFFAWALLLIVHTWNSCLRRSNLPRLQCTCCTVPTTSGIPHVSPLVWVC